MSARTTIILLVLVALAGGAIWWAARLETSTGGGHRLLPGLQSADVRAITLKSERPDVELKGTLSFARTEDSGWTVRSGDESPIRARAERVRTLLESFREAPYQRELTSASKDALEKHGLAPGARVLVDLELASGAARHVEFGAVVSEGGVAARVDGGWPPVEVDRHLLDDLTGDPVQWVETRVLPFEAASAQGIRVTFPKRPESGFRATRESGQWAIREPALQRADQGLLMRLIASLSALDSRGPFEAGESPPQVLVRYEVDVPPRKTPYVIEIGDASRGDMIPAREGTEGAWKSVSLAGFELITQPVAHFRSRRLFDFEPGDVQDVLIGPGAVAPLHLVRRGPRLEFDPPPEWGWKYLGTPRSMPLDPSAQSDFLQALREIEATDFEAGPAFEAARTVVIKHGPVGAPAVETKLRLGADEAGSRAFARLGEAREGRVKTSAVAFLEKPYWEMLARQAYTVAWFSLATIEIDEPGKRRIVASAVTNAGSEPEFVLTEPQGAARRRIPREVLNPVTDKISFLTVERFVGHGSPEKFGLDKPKYVVKWHDSAKSQGVAPDSRTGQWVTWRIAERDSDGFHACDLDCEPGLVFKVSGRDLDPLVNLLEWSAR